MMISLNTTELFGSLRFYRKTTALCVFLTPSAVLLILAILTVPEAITDQGATLLEDTGVAGRFGSHTEKFITFIKTVIYSIAALGLGDAQTRGASKRSSRTRP